MNKLLFKFCLVVSMFIVSTVNVLKAQSNQYLDFDGVDDYVSVTNASQLISGSSAFSMTGWFYDNALGYGQGMMGYRATNAGFYLIELANGQIECRMENSSGVLANYHTANYVIIPQTWQHYAWVYNGANCTLYLNGNVVGSVNASGNIASTTTPFVIGKSILSGQNFVYNGRIDEVSVWNKALTQTEIQDMIANELLGTEPNLKLYYKFNQGVPGGNNTTISSLTTAINSPTYDGTFNNFALNGATSNFNGTLNTSFQAISFPQIPTQLTTSPSYTLNATATSGLPVTYTVLSGPATLNGSTLTFTGAGTVSIQADQYGNATFDTAVSVISTFAVVDPAVNAPVIDPRNPVAGKDVYMPTLGALQLAAVVNIPYPTIFSVQGVQFVINGTTYPAIDHGNGHYTAWWTPAAYGLVTINIVSTSNFGASNTVPVNVNVNQTISNVTNVPAFSGLWLNSSVPSLTADGVLPSFVGAFDTIIATLTLSCPATGGCGAWDHTASVEAMGMDGQWFEIIRYITPYGVACSHTINLADYMSLLQGKVTFRVNCVTFDNGYEYALHFDFKEGAPAHKYSTVTKVWKDIYPFGQYGNLTPVPNFSYTYPATAVASKLKLVSTGHAGPNNTNNAAEFYDATHNIWVNGASTFAQHNWTTCSPNPDNCTGQLGTWYYARAGWCPGSIARPFDYDLSSYIPLTNLDLGYAFYTGYVDHCSAFYPGCVTVPGSCDCNDGLDPVLDVNCNLITFFDDATVLSTKENEKVSMVIYPNPSKGVFNLASINNSGVNYTVSVFDVVGNMVKMFNWNGEHANIDLSSSPKGVYIVKVSNDKTTEINKLIVQ